MADSVRNVANAVLDFGGKLALAPVTPSHGRPLVVSMTLINTDLDKNVTDIQIPLSFMVTAVNATPNEVREGLVRRFPYHFALGPLGLSSKTMVTVEIQFFCGRMHGSGSQTLPALSFAGNTKSQTAPTATLVVFWVCRLAVVDEENKGDIVHFVESIVAKDPVGTKILSPVQKTMVLAFVQDLVQYGQMSTAQ